MLIDVGAAQSAGERELADELAASEAQYDLGQPARIDRDEFYCRFAQPLDAGGNNHRYPTVKPQFDELLASDGRFLDCACGGGAIAIWLALNGKEVWGFDFSPRAIDVARKSAELSGVADCVHFEVMDGR